MVVLTEQIERKKRKKETVSAKVDYFFKDKAHCIVMHQYDPEKKSHQGSDREQALPHSMEPAKSLMCLTPENASFDRSSR